MVINNDISVLVLFTKAQFGDVREANVVFLFVCLFWLAFTENKVTGKK